MSTGKVIIVTGEFPSLSETFVAQDARLLRGLGLPLLLAALRPGAGAGSAPPDCPVEYLVAGVPGVARERGRAALLLRRLVPPALRMRLALRRQAPALAALQRLVQTAGCRHIHAEFAGLPALLAAAAARHGGIPFSVGAHARDVFVPEYPLASLLSGAAFVTVCNGAAAAALRAAAPGLEPRLHLIPHGVCLDDWPFTERTAMPAAAQHLLFAGRFVPKKGLELLLDAFALLVAGNGPRPALHLVGDGPLAPALRRRAERLGIACLTVWHGWCKPASLAGHFSHAALLAVPAVLAPDGDRDGIPNIMLQGMAAGLPVAGTAVGGLTELLDDTTGWLCRELTPQAFAAILRAALEQPAAGASRARAARRRVEAEYDAKSLARRRLNLFG